MYPFILNDPVLAQYACCEQFVQYPCLPCCEQFLRPRNLSCLPYLQYLIKVNEIKAKKGVDLLQHLVDFHHAQDK